MLVGVVSLADGGLEKVGTAPCIGSLLLVTWIALATVPAHAQQTRDSTVAAMAAMRVDLRKWAAAESSFIADSGHPGEVSPDAFKVTKGNEGFLNGPRFWGPGAWMSAQRARVTCWVYVGPDTTLFHAPSSQPTCAGDRAVPPQIARLLGGELPHSDASSPLSAQVVPPLRQVAFRLSNVVDSGAYFVYLYRVANAADSKSGAATVSLDVSAPSGMGFRTLPATGPFVHVVDTATVTLWAYRDHVPVGSISPTNWSGKLAKEGWLSWSGAYSGGFELSIVPPGATLGGFGLRSPFLPGIRQSAADPTVAASCCGPRPSPGMGPPPKPSDGWAVGPTYAAGQATLGVLRALLERSCGELAWITQAGVCHDLRSKLSQAATAVRRSDRDGAKRALQGFRDALEAQYGPGKPVAENAYWVLRVNADYLVRHAASTSWQDPFPPFVVREFAALKRSGTYDDWRHAHPNDSLAAFAPGGIDGGPEDWCARASTEQRLPDSSRVVRRAYFFAPPLTPQSTLPAPATPEALVRQCVLGAVWVEVGVPTVADGSRRNAETADTLVAAYKGAVQPWVSYYQPPFGGISEWKVAGPWLADATTILSGAEMRSWRGASRVFALAYRPVSGLAPSSRLPGFDIPARTFAEKSAADAAHVAEAARLTGLKQGEITPLLSLLAQAESARAGLTHPDHTALRAAAVSTLGHWLEHTRPLEPARRAGALLAADRLLGTDPVEFLFLSPEDSVDGRGPLAALGAQFEEVYKGEVAYAHTWLADAVSLDPTSRAGNLAFMSRIGGCDPGPVIEQGESFMNNLSDPVLRAQLEFTLADAYADSVGMTAGVAPEARATALDHYRAGLAIDRTSPLARVAWTKAWRLLAGLPPRAIRFHCDRD